jgi:hypothetical protein
MDAGVCTKAQRELVIVSRDSDYGVLFDNQAYVNDHLRQEFSERVSQKRKLLLYSKLSEALKHFEVPVTKQEEQGEGELIRLETEEPLHLGPLTRLFQQLLAEKGRSPSQPNLSTSKSE